MPGIRMGYVLASAENIARIKKHLPEWNLSVTSEAAIKAGIKMISETDFVKKSIDEIIVERSYLTEELKKLGFKVYDSDTSFILFKAGADLFEKLLDERILIRNCNDHRGLGKGYYRVGARNHEDNVKLIKALQKIV
jgi:threonine-phosphate decarboxylase